MLISAASIPAGLFRYFTRGRSRGSGTSQNSPTVTGNRFLPLAFGEVGARFIAFGATILIARRLGPSGFGQIAFATALVANLGFGMILAIGEAGARDVARRPRRASRIAFEGVAARLLCVIATVIAVAVIGRALKLEVERRTIVILYGIALIPMAFDTSWVHKGLGRTGRVATSLLLAQATALTLVVLLITAPSDVMRVPWVQFTGDFLAAMFLVFPLLTSKSRLPSVAAVVQMLRKSRLLMVSRTLRGVIVSFDIVLLGFMVASQQVGWYSAAYRIVFFIVAVISAAHMTFLPEISRSAGDSAALSIVLSRAIGFALTVTIPFVIVGTFLATPMMTMAFGKGYEQGAAALQILLLSVLILGVHGVTRLAFIGMRRLGLEMIITGVGAIVNVAVNFSLIPIYGIRGAAVATVAGETVILVGAFVALARLGVRPGIRDSIPAVVAGVVLAGAMLLIGSDHTVIQSMIIAGLVYLVSIAALTMLSHRSDAPLTIESR